MPLVWERAYLDVPSVPNRRTPFVIAYPLDFSGTIEFITPAGGEIEQQPATDIHSDTAFITWNLHAEPAERRRGPGNVVAGCESANAGRAVCDRPEDQGAMRHPLLAGKPQPPAQRSGPGDHHRVGGHESVVRTAW